MACNICGDGRRCSNAGGWDCSSGPSFLGYARRQPYESGRSECCHRKCDEKERGRFGDGRRADTVAAAYAQIIADADE